MRRSIALGLTAALLATGSLAACSSRTADAGSTTDDPGSTPAEVTADESAAEETAVEETAARTGGAECLIGDWSYDMSFIAESLAAAFSGGAPDGASATSAEVTGESIMSFDGTVETMRFEALTMTMSIDANGIPLTIEVGYDGSSSAPYTATNGSIVVEPFDLSSISITGSATAEGETMDLTDQVSSSTSMIAVPATEATYTCTDTTLVLTTHNGANTVSQEYTRR